MHRLVVITAALLCASCASLQNAGTAEYSVSPIITRDGETICCSVLVKNGKEIANLEAHIKKRGDDYSVDLIEQGVAAFDGQGIAAGALKSAIDAAVKAALAAAGVMVVP